MNAENLILAGAWAIYLLLHSLLAAGVVKNWFANTLHLSGRYYRLFYSLISTVLILPLLGYLLVTDSGYLFVSTYLSAGAGLVLLGLGGWILLKSFEYISGEAFLGLKDEPNQGLIIRGLHAKMRHPIYTGTLLVVFGIWLYLPSVNMTATALAIIVYLPFGIYWEEKKLIRLFGDHYIKYKRDVPALIPRIF